ncbi:MAG: peroxide stress protein YaaA [Gammaproteobacteria bacterium]|nr:peroxide stress protein YaaA [Gammaproteobacteria bacterium]MYF38565.1 peroxide stress protein YaaA [Gammaproteobacteria bacterium]
MLTVLSPSKNLDFEKALTTRKQTEPTFHERTSELITQLQKLSARNLAEMMDISDDLAGLNYERYQNWTTVNGKRRPAILSFRGDVYLGLGAESFGERDLTAAQRRLRILSGLYGVLRPLDAIQPYRLEMGSTLLNKQGSDLYAYWNDEIATALNSELANHKSAVLVNAASNEYMSDDLVRKINYRVVHCKFLQRHRDDYRFMSYYGKRARGLLARFVVLSRLDNPSRLRDFNAEGYYYSHERSTRDSFVFLRDHRP